MPRTETDLSHLVGTKFERLEVLRSVQKRNRNSQRFLCRCDCGNEIEVDYSALRRGQTKSCKCLGVARRREVLMHADRSETAKRGYYAKWKNLVSKRKKPTVMELSYEEWLPLISSNCYYCGKPPNKIFVPDPKKNRSDCIPFHHHGIDRKDNDRGYVLDNCVPCCRDCNFAKRTLNDTQFLELAKQIVKHALTREVMC